MESISARRGWQISLLAVLACLLPIPVMAYLDLAAARVERLDNGLTLIVLEEHALPVVSVQMLYRIGAKNETAGATGLAHFVEHMAFRDAEGFPDTRLVSSIYAAGGEWHGYTWLDQTTYFATVPKESLDLLLDIEAARMCCLDISPEDVIVERGAVITEMHSYENDPASVLHDNVMYLTFLAHPYRNNTIGWESDVAQMSYDDVVAFYRQHYHPGNAILAVVGDVQTEEVIQAVEARFGSLPAQAPTPEPHTMEPPQNGERRMRMQGELDQKYFKIAYRAPAASDPAYAAFLVMQELLAGGSGVSFLQNDWGTPVRPGSALASVSGELSTWFPPSAQQYVFVISGTEPATADEKDIEAAIEQAIGALQQQLAAEGKNIATGLARAKQRVLRELVFDAQTTEDAAHQLAFFAGLDALDRLITLPTAVARVSAQQVAAVMAHYLRADQRNIAWYVPAKKTAEAAEPEAEVSFASLAVPAPAVDGAMRSTQAAGNKISRPILVELESGLPIIMQPSSLSPTVSLRVITPAAEFAADAPAVPNQPGWGMTSLEYDALAPELVDILARSRSALETAKPLPSQNETDTGDPEAMLQSYFEDILGLKAEAADVPLAPLAVIITGDFNPDGMRQALEGVYGDLAVTTRKPGEKLTAQGQIDIESSLTVSVAQEELGYVTQAPGPQEADAAAWRMLLYILSHGYEGRLGKAAISEQGLIYYISSDYNTDGTSGWITLDMGVDPDKMPALKKLLREKLIELEQQPPTQEEADEARNHLLGRFVSAAQSNPELARQLAREWLWYGQAISYEELQTRLLGVRRDDILRIVPNFVSGSTVAVRNPSDEEKTQ